MQTVIWLINFWITPELHFQVILFPPISVRIAAFFHSKIMSIWANIPIITCAPLTLPPSQFRTILTHVAPVSADDLGMVVQSLNCSTSSLDPLSVFNCLSRGILTIVNTSLQPITFPSSHKSAIVKPLLKKPTLDGSITSNDRPISNLPFLSTIIENSCSQAANRPFGNQQSTGSLPIRLSTKP